MGTGDNIRKSAENALKDLAGLSGPADDAHAPDPGSPQEEIGVHSSISEGSNAADAPTREPLSSGTSAQPPGQGSSENIVRDGSEDRAPAQDGDGGTAAEEPRVPPQGVPGPAGLPGPDPASLHADPSEGDADPSASMGREEH